VTLITSTDRTVQVSVQTRSMLGPEDAFRLIVPIDLSLVFEGWGIVPRRRRGAKPDRAWDAVSSHDDYSSPGPGGWLEGASSRAYATSPDGALTGRSPEMSTYLAWAYCAADGAGPWCRHG
jgi:hypothetical protein